MGVILDRAWLPPTGYKPPVHTDYVEELGTFAAWPTSPDWAMCRMSLRSLCAIIMKVTFIRQGTTNRGSGRHMTSWATFQKP